MQKTQRNDRLSVALAACGFLFAGAANAAVLTRGPYLQTQTSEGVIVCWRSDTAANSVVRVGTDPDNLSLTFTNTSVSTDHSVRVTGLAAQTRYYYSVGSSSEVLSRTPDNTFLTSPVTGNRTPFRVWAIGDAGTGTSNQAAVYQAYRHFTGDNPTHFWLQLGDNAYSLGTDAQYQTNMFNMYPQLLCQSTTWPVFGNHDGYSANSSTQTGAYYSIFRLPTQAQAGGIASGTEAYYSFDYGNAHFVVLDSTESSLAVGGPMYNWLEADLQANSADWLIIAWHHGAYSRGSHNSDSDSFMTAMRRNFVPLVESHGVDLVLSGHSHSYERSKFITGHTGNASTFSDTLHTVQAGSGREDDTGAYTKTLGATNAGTVYAVVGSSGQTSGGLLNHPAMYVSYNELGSLVLDVDGLTLNARFLDNNGVTRDYFTLRKMADEVIPLGSIDGLVWHDTNRDGLRDSGEMPLADISVSLHDSNQQLLDTRSTNASGIYSFGNLAGGTYQLRFNRGDYLLSPQDQGEDDARDSDANMNDGSTALIAVTAGESVHNVDAGLALPPTSHTTTTLRDGLNGYAGTTDTYVASGRATSTYGSQTSLRADGSDGTSFRQVALLRWATTTLPTTAQIGEAALTLNVLNPSVGSFDIYAMNRSWSESTANWNNTTPPTNLGVLIGSFTPTVNGNLTVPLNSAGLALIQGWLDGSIPNNGIVIIDRSNDDGMVLASSEYGTATLRPALTVTYH